MAHAELGAARRAAGTYVILSQQPGHPVVWYWSNTKLDEKVATAAFNLGVAGEAAGPDVYIFDKLSLSNPVGSHLIEPDRTRPGHSQLAGEVWMIAMLPPSHPLSPAQLAAADTTQAEVDAARRALGCGTVQQYLHSVSAPLTPSLMLSNMWHAATYTTFKMSSSPAAAAQQTCRR